MSKGGGGWVGRGGGSRSHPRSQKASPDYTELFSPRPSQCEWGIFNYFQGHRLFSFYCLVIPPPRSPYHPNLLWFGEKAGLGIGRPRAVFTSDEKPLLLKLFLSSVIPAASFRLLPLLCH